MSLVVVLPSFVCLLPLKVDPIGFTCVLSPQSVLCAYTILFPLPLVSLSFCLRTTCFILFLLLACSCWISSMCSFCSGLFVVHFGILLLLLLFKFCGLGLSLDFSCTTSQHLFLYPSAFSLVSLCPECLHLGPSIMLSFLHTSGSNLSSSFMRSSSRMVFN